jgi:hypothetical protein
VGAGHDEEAGQQEREPKDRLLPRGVLSVTDHEVGGHQEDQVAQTVDPVGQSAPSGIGEAAGCPRSEEQQQHSEHGDEHQEAVDEAH